MVSVSAIPYDVVVIVVVVVFVVTSAVLLMNALARRRGSSSEEVRIRVGDGVFTLSELRDVVAFLNEVRAVLGANRVIDLEKLVSLLAAQPTQTQPTAQPVQSQQMQAKVCDFRECVKQVLSRLPSEVYSPYHNKKVRVAYDWDDNLGLIAVSLDEPHIRLWPPESPEEQMAVTKIEPKPESASG